jgi:Methyltransferase FkbM domain
MNAAVDPVTLFNSAVSDESGHGRMQVERGGTTGGTVTTGGDGTIPITTLDDALADAPVDQIDLLKLDIEGAEVDALHGAAEILTRTRRVIVEYHSRDLLAGCNEILEQTGFATDLTFVYYPEGNPLGGSEVGMLYAHRAVA